MPENSADTQSIANSARAIVVGRPDFVGRARRDVHVKHHGLLRAKFTVDPNFKGPLKTGVFAAKDSYQAWVRFSNSSKTAQTDEALDGRGVAIKLLEVEGAPRLLPEEQDQPETQDFIFLNGPAFFARNAADMKIVAKLQATDTFPSLFFFTLPRLRGLLNLFTMSMKQADSPLGLTYYTQAPFRLGALSVKYRLLPLDTPLLPPGKKPRSGPNYLFDALREHVQVRNEPFSFRLEVQRQQAGDDVDDATQVWGGPFETVGTLQIPAQEFGTVARMDLAERFSFNPYNGLAEHEPLGSINLARFWAYKASFAARRDGNGWPAGRPEYTKGEWEAPDDPGGPPYVPPEYPSIGLIEQLLNALAHVFPSPAAWFASFMSGPWAYLFAPGLLALFLLYGVVVPGGLARPFAIPLPWLLPSEALVPPAVPAGGWTLAALENSTEMPLTFRYKPVGTEANGGMPYWVFRAMPYMCPDKFGIEGDPLDGGSDDEITVTRAYSKFGFDTPDDKTYYEDYHELPRGFVLVQDTDYAFAGTTFAVKLNRVAFNCATCHRGEYIGDDDRVHFVDGMPSQRIDTAGYQKAAFGCTQSSTFTPDRLVQAIEKILAQRHRAEQYRSHDDAPTLTWAEKIVYAGIVSQMKATVLAEPIDWKDLRPMNGPGRLDAFGALRYEYLPQDPVADAGHLIATVDLPSIWHQGKDWRPWHHWDGNTADGVARSFGAAIGVGATPLSLRRYTIQAVSDWIDKDLAPPRYPFRSDPPPKGDPGRGKGIYESQCSTCHGRYRDSDRKLVSLVSCMSGDTSAMAATQIGTDWARATAVDRPFIDKLDAFGVGGGLWTATAFRPTQLYQCPPLDGIWARAPYLHNGSVPTLKALLGPEAKRPKLFCRGRARYLTEEGGFDYHLAPKDPPAPSDRPTEGDHCPPAELGKEELFLFDTALEGNGNAGHAIPLAEADFPDLLAYLYTL